MKIKAITKYPFKGKEYNSLKEIKEELHNIIMNNKGNISIFKNDTISLVKTTKEDFWLYDYTRGQNISMRAKTEQDALIEGLMYYQKRLKKVEKEFKSLESKVINFVNLFIEDEKDSLNQF